MSTPPLQILQVAEGLSPRLGGTSSVPKSLAKQLIQNNCDVTLLALSDAEDTDKELGGVNIQTYPATLSSRLGFSLSLHFALRKKSDFDLVHLQGLWRLHYLQAFQHAKKQKIPVVISVHGMLHPWALSHKKYIKAFARVLYQDTLLEHADCLHASSQGEADFIREIGFKQPIAIIPLGIDLPILPSTSPHQVSSWKIPAEKRILLSMSRLHPVKGTDLLLKSWVSLQKEFPDWILVLSGQDEGGFKTELLKIIAEADIRDRVVFTDFLENEAKSHLLHQAKAFVLPSHSENFGLVVPEALSCGVPVLTTQGTPWALLEEKKCGWWIDLNQENLTNKLQEVLSKKPQELETMGKNGKKYVEQNLTWEKCSHSMLEVYHWLLKKESKPDFVFNKSKNSK